jgi:hypothetical protein
LRVVVLCLGRSTGVLVPGPGLDSCSPSPRLDNGWLGATSKCRRCVNVFQLTVIAPVTYHCRCLLYQRLRLSTSSGGRKRPRTARQTARTSVQGNTHGASAYQSSGAQGHCSVAACTRVGMPRWCVARLCPWLSATTSDVSVYSGHTMFRCRDLGIVATHALSKAGDNMCVHATRSQVVLPCSNNHSSACNALPPARVLSKA